MTSIQSLQQLSTKLPNVAFVTESYTAVESAMKAELMEGMSELNLQLTILEGDNINASCIQALEIQFKFLLAYQPFLSKQASNFMPAEFATTQAHVLSKLKGIIIAHAARFNKALAIVNFVQIEPEHTIAKQWEPMITQVKLYLERIGQVEIIQSYRSAEQLGQLVKETVAEIEKRLNSLTRQSLLESTARSSDARQIFFQNISNDIDFIAKAGALVSKDLLRTAVAKLTTYLNVLFTESLKQVGMDWDIETSWTEFSLSYIELHLFTQNCGTNPQLNQLLFTTPKDMLAVDASHEIKKAFEQSLNNKIIQHQLLDIHDAKARGQVLQFLTSLQKIIEELPAFSLALKKKVAGFLQAILDGQGPHNLQLIATDLQADTSSYGLAIINGQKCFSGLAIAIRNEATQRQGIEYVLERLQCRVTGSNSISLAEEQKNTLRALYETYEQVYRGLIDNYLKPERDFSNHEDALSGELRNAIHSLISSWEIEKNSLGKILWSEKMKEGLPLLIAHIFAIWTLRDSQAYFKAFDLGNRNMLKVPHASQIVALFMEFNLLSNMALLPSAMQEIGSGEGKSVVMAVTSIICALLGMSVKSVCYSEYLSSRDYADFRPIFEFLNVADKIEYSTINEMLEKELNRGGKQRDLVKALIQGEELPLMPFNSREEVTLIIDEVDVFLQRDFYGALYQPFFIYQTSNIEQLIRQIWALHQSGKSVNLGMVRELSEYTSVFTDLGQWAFLLDAAVECMVRDLNSYQPKQGHEYEVDTVNDRIVYRYQDGLSTTQTKGYKTLWAYFYEQSLNKLSKGSEATQLGLNINCGSFSYANLINDGRFSTMLGVTGTLAQLSLPEQAVLNEFSIQQETFLPSVFGENKLTFNEKAGVKVESERDFHMILRQEIAARQLGAISEKPVRPVIVFFETQEELEQFYHSPQMQDLKATTNLMTSMSASTLAERQAEILRATRRGNITLALNEFARGRDFICMDKMVDADGGLHVIGTSLNELAEERQMMRRTARQGQNGSFSMVLLAKKLTEQFAEKVIDKSSAPKSLQDKYTPIYERYGHYVITNALLNEWRSKDILYEKLHQVRISQFAHRYTQLKHGIEQTKTVLHQPSMQLSELLRQPTIDVENIKPLLKIFNPSRSIMSTEKAKNARIAILVDGTGSMGDVMYGIKTIIESALFNLCRSLTSLDLTIDLFSIMLVVFRNYEDTIAVVSSPWTNQYKDMQSFISKNMVASGGLDAGEAMELGLEVVNQEIDKGIVPTQVIVIGDIHYHSASLVEQRRRSYNYTKKEEAYSAATEINKLARNRVPVNAIATARSALSFFDQHLAQPTKGSSQYLSIDDQTLAGEKLYRLFGKAVIADVALGNPSMQEALMAAYGKSFK